MMDLWAGNGEARELGLTSHGMPTRQGVRNFHILFKSCEHVCSATPSCLTLCNLLDCSPPGSFHRIFQARILAWVAISCSRRSSQPRDWTCVSCTSCISRWIFYRLLTYLNLTTVLWSKHLPSYEMSIFLLMKWFIYISTFKRKMLRLGEPK